MRACFFRRSRITRRKTEARARGAAAVTRKWRDQMADDFYKALRGALRAAGRDTEALKLLGFGHVMRLLRVDQEASCAMLRQAAWLGSVAMGLVTKRDLDRVMGEDVDPRLELRALSSLLRTLVDLEVALVAPTQRAPDGALVVVHEGPARYSWRRPDDGPAEATEPPLDLEALRRETQERKRELEALRRKSRRGKKELEALSQQNERDQAELEALRQTCEARRRELDEMRAYLEGCDEAHAALLERRDRLERDRAGLTLRVRELEDEIAEAEDTGERRKRSLAELEADLEAKQAQALARTRAASKERAALKADRQALEADRTALEADRQALEADKSDLDAWRRALEAGLAEARDLEDQLDREAARLTAWTAEQCELQVSLAGWESQLQGDQADLDAKRAELERALADMEQLRDALDRSRADLDRWQSDLEARCADLEARRAGLGELHGALDALRARLGAEDTGLAAEKQRLDAKESELAELGIRLAARAASQRSWTSALAVLERGNWS